MADPLSLSSPNRRLAVLLTLEWGDPDWPGGYAGKDPEGGVVRFTSWGEPITIAGQIFTPMQAIAVEMRDLDGGADEPDDGMFVLRVARSAEPFTSTIDQQIVLRAVIEHYDVDSGVREPIARGTSGPSERPLGSTPAGSGVVELKFVGLRSRLRVALGIRCDASCNHTFGDAECGVDLSGVQFQDRITSISGRVVRSPILNTLPIGSTGTMPSAWARFGRVERGGLVIPIIDHVDDAATLRFEPPPSWLDQFVLFTAGCNKSVARCRDFNNESRFGGFGVGMPAYSPILNDRA